MNNCNKIKNTCPDNTYATCVDYQGEIGEKSKITEGCITIHDTTEDIYQLIDQIFESIDMTELGSDCILYGTEKNLKAILKRQEKEICDLKSEVEILKTQKLCDISIEGCNLSLGILTDVCDEPLTTFKSLIQAMINQINTNTD